MTDQAANVQNVQNVQNAYPDPGEVPVLDWIDKALISVDPLYQRPLDHNRVATILKGFYWRSFGALVVVPQADGQYHATDGQHRLEAAKLHPKVQHVPVVIVKADDIQAEAGIFVDINRVRKNVTGLELFFAQLAADDPRAVAVLSLCKQAGIRIPKHPGDYKPGDSVAVGALAAIEAGYAEERALRILTTAGAGKFKPITAAHLKAVEHLLNDPEFRDQIVAEDLSALLERDGNMHDGEAKRFAATHRVSTWKGLASVWFQKTRKRRSPAQTGIRAEPVPERFRTFVPHTVATLRNVTAAVAGDPPPGRSALDQRRAG